MSEKERERESERRKCAWRLSCGQSIYVIPFPLSSNCEQDVNRNSCWHLPQCAPASPARVLSDSSTHCEVDEGEEAEGKVDERTIHLNLCTSLCNNSAHSSDSSTTCHELFRFLPSESVKLPIVICLL